MSQRESDSTAFSVGKGARIGRINVGGNVAGRDVVVGTTPAEAAAAQDMSQVLAVLEQVQQQIATLEAAPQGLRDDAHDEVVKAQQAGAEGDTDRFVEKLGTAQKYLERIGQSLPAAVALAQTVATLAMRVSGQG